MEIEGAIDVPAINVDTGRETLHVRQEVPIRGVAREPDMSDSDNDTAAQDRDNGIQMVRLNLVLTLKSSCCVHCPRK